MSSKLDKALAALKPRDRLFVEAFAGDPASPTFGKALPSIAKAAPNLTKKARPAAAQRAKQKETVQIAVAAVLEDIGFGLADRATLTKRLALTDSQTITHKDASGQVTHRVETPVPVAARLKAIDIANKLDGSYAKAEAAVDIAKREYEQTLKALERKLW